jgi:ribosomal protein S18 acetylase RimI-like enzyme
MDFSVLLKNYVAVRSETAFSLRAMVASDESHFRHFYAQSRSAELAPVNWTAQEKLAFCNTQYDLQDAHYRKFYEDFTPLAICIGDVTIGRLYLANMDNLCLLMDIIVEAQYQRRGIARTIMGVLCTQADMNPQAINLHVEPLNPARKLYQQFGFVDLPNQTEAQISIEMRRPALTKR